MLRLSVCLLFAFFLVLALVATRASSDAIDSHSQPPPAKFFADVLGESAESNSQPPKRRRRRKHGNPRKQNKPSRNDQPTNDDVDVNEHSQQIEQSSTWPDTKPEISDDLVQKAFEMNERAIRTAESGNTQEALPFFIEAAKINPYDAFLENNVGVTHMRNGESWAAAQSFCLAMKKWPDRDMRQTIQSNLNDLSKHVGERVDCNDVRTGDPAWRHTADGAAVQDLSLIKGRINSQSMELKRHIRRRWLFSHDMCTRFFPVNRDNLVTVVEDVLTAAEAEWVIYEAEKHALNTGGWTTNRHKNYPTVDLAVSNIPSLAMFGPGAIEKIMQAIVKRWQVPRTEIGISDLFVAKYSPHGLQTLDIHTDNSEFSFVMSLNGEDEFTGGGTAFGLEELRPNGTSECYIVRPKAGSAALFSGQQLHQGAATTWGERYIMTGFIHFKSNGYCRDRLHDLTLDVDEWHLPNWHIEQLHDIHMSCNPIRRTGQWISVRE